MGGSQEGNAPGASGTATHAGTRFDSVRGTPALLDGALEALHHTPAACCRVLGGECAYWREGAAQRGAAALPHLPAVPAERHLLAKHERRLVVDGLCSRRVDGRGQGVGGGSRPGRTGRVSCPCRCKIMLPPVAFHTTCLNQGLAESSAVCPPSAAAAGTPPGSTRPAARAPASAPPASSACRRPRLSAFSSKSSRRDAEALTATARPVPTPAPWAPRTPLAPRGMGLQATVAAIVL